MHGLSTYGFAARALLKAVANNDPKALRFIGVRFTAPVKPGDALETRIWEVGPGPNGTTEVTFITTNLTTSKVSVVHHIWRYTQIYGLFRLFLAQVSHT